MGKWADTRDRRFDERVARGPDCHLWLGSTTTAGYGQLRVDGRRQYAHRYALERIGVRLSANDLVCHRCDVPACVNPAHLFVGTHRDNMADCVAKGRLNPHGRQMTHCHLGHPFDTVNTHILPSGARRCRKCHTAKARATRLAAKVERAKGAVQ